MSRPALAVAAALVAFPVAAAEPLAGFDAYEDAHQFDCNGPWEHFSPADVRTVGAFRYEHTGATVKLTRVAPKPKGPAKLGLLAGIKDAEPDTLALVRTFLARFEQEDVDAVVLGGDTSSEPDVLEKLYAFFAEATKRPVLSIAGNMERGASHAYAILKARKAGALHLLNLDMIRRADGEGFDVVSLGGYHDKAYLHLSGGCLYTEQHLETALTAAKSADDPVVWLSHGPPRGKGKTDIDYVPGAGNVGDPRINDVLTRAKIRFGVSGHILEAAGKATDLAGKVQPQKRLVPTLFVNQGSANPLPWKLNDGGTSYGLAAVLTLDGGKASYEILKGPKPAPTPAP